MAETNDTSAAAAATTRKAKRYEALAEEAGGRVNLMDSDTRCGCGPFKPRWLQSIVGPKLFTVHMGLVLAIHFGMTAYFSGILTTIERQFELSSSESGGLTMINDVAILCLVMIVSYYGHNSHRPRLLAGGGLIISLGLFICAIPHFMADPIDPSTIIVGGSGRGRLPMGASLGGICNSQIDAADNRYNISQIASDVAKPFGRYNGTSQCAGDMSKDLGLVKWLVIGQIIVGIGAAPLFPLVVSYIDDSVRKHELTSYTGKSQFRSLFSVLYLCSKLFSPILPDLLRNTMRSSMKPALYQDLFSHMLILLTEMHF